MENDFENNVNIFNNMEDETTQLVNDILNSDRNDFLIDTFFAEEESPEKNKDPFAKLKNLWAQKGKFFVDTACSKAKDFTHAVEKKVKVVNPKHKKYIFAGAAGILAVLVLFCVLGLTVLRSPAAKVGIAFQNTASELANVSDLWELDNLVSVMTQKGHSVDLDMRINSIEGEDALSGTGVRVMVDSNLNKRKLGLQIVPYVGSTELMHAMVAAEDEVIYFSSPEFMPDIYGLNTVTMMEDLDYLGAELGNAKDVSFNLFDVLELVQEMVVNSEDTKKIMTDAWEELLASVSVEKGKKQTIRVNGFSTECKTYNAVIPEDAIEYFLETLEDLMTSQDYEEMLEEILDSMNFPRSLTKEIVSEFEFTEPDFDEIYDLLDEIGDVELRLFIKNNRIAAIRFESEIYDSEYEAGLYIGGGDRYVDNIGLKLENEYSEIVIKSSGDHSAKKGVFTDKTTVEVDGEKITIQVVYNPKSDSDNLSVVIEDDRDAIEVNGTYLVNSRSLQLILDEIVYEYRAEEELDVSFGIQVGKYENRTDVAEARLLSELDKSDIEQIAEEVESMTSQWVMDLVEDNPQLKYMF